MRFRLAAAAVGLSLLPVMALPVQASASPEIGGFGVRPAHFTPSDPATRAYFKHRVAAGGVFSDEAVVSNPGTDPVDLRVYPVDGLTAVTSGAVYSNRTDPLRHAGRWVSTPVRYLTVPPHSQRLVSFTVYVPQSAVAGDHLAGIAFEGAHPQTSGGRFSVTEVVREVLGIEVIVAGPAQQQLRLNGISLRALPGTSIPSAVVQLANVGRQLCKPKLTVSLQGSSAGSQEVGRQLDTILPGDAIPYPLPWPRPLKAGTYVARATASGCGPMQTVRRTVQLRAGLSGTAGHPGGAVSARAQASSSSSWWIFLVVAICGVAAGMLMTGARRRRH